MCVGVFKKVRKIANEWISTCFKPWRFAVTYFFLIGKRHVIKTPYENGRGTPIAPLIFSPRTSGVDRAAAADWLSHAVLPHHLHTLNPHCDSSPRSLYLLMIAGLFPWWLITSHENISCVLFRLLQRPFFTCCSFICLNPCLSNFFAHDVPLPFFLSPYSPLFLIHWLTYKQTHRRAHIYNIIIHTH